VSQATITIKGIRQGLLAKLGEGEWDSILQELAERVEATPAFFHNGRLALDVGEHELGRGQLEHVRELLAGYHVELWAVLSTNSVTQLVAHDMGLVVNLELPQPKSRQRAAPAPTAPDPLAEGVVVRRTLRSGQSFQHPGNVVIFGDVNPGAEVVAGGHIVVWGRARGFLHAGAMGDERAVICALDLGATQLRIAGHIARAPEGRVNRPVPEMASIRDGQIVAVPWRGSEPGHPA
jgi:septum site-determining protein MinC